MFYCLLSSKCYVKTQEGQNSNIAYLGDQHYSEHDLNELSGVFSKGLGKIELLTYKLPDQRKNGNARN